MAIRPNAFIGILIGENEEVTSVHFSENARRRHLVPVLVEMSHFNAGIFAATQKSDGILKICREFDFVLCR